MNPTVKNSSEIRIYYSLILTPVELYDERTLYYYSWTLTGRTVQSLTSTIADLHLQKKKKTQAENDSQNLSPKYMQERQSQLLLQLNPKMKEQYLIIYYSWTPLVQNSLEFGIYGSLTP